MKNSNPYLGDAFAFYKKVCAKKQDAALKARLLAMDVNIQAFYQDYDQHFAGNVLEQMAPAGYVDLQRADLHELYDFKSAALKKLNADLSTTETGRVIKCQQCTINDVHTFDHIVPQGEFAEFVVHPKNLIGSCSDCNARKSHVWRNAGRRTSLNLYLDILPDVQYLYVRADVGNRSINTEYYLENRNGVDPALFALLEEHYRRLNLFQRFADGSDTVISSLRNILEPMHVLGDPALVRQIVEGSVSRDKKAFGHNYWQSVLKMALLDDEDFMIDFQ
ncbi:hypothetical protein ABDD95_12690 [Mucilaginibacter sp. PAMB04274]|uniref:HNH endonuclease n=1 Tax=Mucilaginibacter sp. PAMB04274 TaxID=3138568 RepID=UPI0031F694A8